MITNEGQAFACGLICVWPIIVHLLLLYIGRRVRAVGWRGLIFGVKPHDE